MDRSRLCGVGFDSISVHDVTAHFVMLAACLLVAVWPQLVYTLALFCTAAAVADGRQPRHSVC